MEETQKPEDANELYVKGVRRRMLKYNAFFVFRKGKPNNRFSDPLYLAYLNETDGDNRIRCEIHEMNPDYSTARGEVKWIRFEWLIFLNTYKVNLVDGKWIYDKETQNDGKVT